MTPSYRLYQAKRGQSVQALLPDALAAYQERTGQAAGVILAHPSEAPGLVGPPGVRVTEARQVDRGTLGVTHDPIVTPAQMELAL